MLETRCERLFTESLLPAWQIIQICEIHKKLILRFMITISAGLESDLPVRYENVVYACQDHVAHHFSHVLTFCGVCLLSVYKDQ